MAASVITRAALVDNVTLWSAATVNSAVYDAIDSMFGGAGSYTTFEFGGAVKVTGALTPVANNTPALGSSSLMWADIFLGDGAVVNFNNGDVTMTHATNTLTFAGASSGYLFDTGIKVSTVGVLVSGFYDFLNGGSWDVIGYANGTSSLAIGGYRSSQWLETRFYTSGSERMRIDSSGNVGIGVTPSAWTASGKFLEIGSAGNIIQGAANTFSQTLNANFDSGWKYGTSSFASRLLHTSGEFQFYTAPSGTAGNSVTFTERFRILNGGNVGIGSTARFYLDGTAGTGDTYLQESSGNEFSIYVGGTQELRLDNNTLLVPNVFSDTTASAANVFVDSNGRMSRSTSSLRYKHDAATLDTAEAMTAVMAMRPVTYRGKEDDDQRRFVGFIAEEMQEIAPLLCTYDEGGETGTPNYVTYDRVTAYLVAVVQQQQQKIAALEARLH